jgi:hypothetical protein
VKLRRRWNILLLIVSLLILAAAAPLLYVESLCRSPMPGYAPALHYASLVPGSERRAEAQTWLTYPEWYIVYSAESLGRHLEKGPPSGYSYWQDVRNFWSGYCLVNRVTGDMRGADQYKLMIYAIGLSFSAEMLVKGFYENTIGRLFEFISGWPSGDDRYAAKVQQTYADFMHETPWYRFPFGGAFTGLWSTNSGGYFLRHWERRFALSLEYGVKTGYAKAIDLATGATIGRDQPTLFLVARASPGQLAAVDPRLRLVRAIPADQGGGVVVQAPRYAAFTTIVQRLVDRGIPLVEIAGNDDIFVSFVMPRPLDTREGVVLMSERLPDRPNMLRVSASTKVARLGAFIREARAQGGTLEHVYDY